MYIRFLTIAFALTVALPAHAATPDPARTEKNSLTRPVSGRDCPPHYRWVPRHERNGRTIPGRCVKN